jgi:hypothetical protein
MEDVITRWIDLKASSMQHGGDGDGDGSQQYEIRSDLLRLYRNASSNSANNAKFSITDYRSNVELAARSVLESIIVCGVNDIPTNTRSCSHGDRDPRAGLLMAVHRSINKTRSE